MKVYMFYNTYYGSLNPTLYAYTDNKVIADEFKKERLGLSPLVKECTKTEYRNMRDKLDNLRIIQNSFHSRNAVRPGHTVLMPTTNHEAMEFALHKTDMLTQYLGVAISGISPTILDDGLLKVLDAMGFSGYYDAINGVHIDPFLLASSTVCNYDYVEPWCDDYYIDELALFLENYKYTFIRRKD